MWVVIAATYALMSIATFVAFWLDKRAAVRNQWRTPESTLHVCELLGGWPGSFVAQRLLRHKSRKVRYQLVFWAIIVLHAAVWTAWLVLTQTSR